MSESRKGKLIVIEGIDGSGKSTQTNLLMRAFERDSREVKTMHFPQHGKFPFGRLVDWYLFGRFGDPVKLNPRLVSWLYALDRWQASFTIRQWLRSGAVVVLDRYTTSNMGHQLGKLKSDEEKDRFLVWLEKLEYKMLNIPKPDLVLFLDVCPDMVSKLIDKRAGEPDGHETNMEHLALTYHAYNFVVDIRPEWHRVTCIINGRLLTPEEVHARVWVKVHEQLENNNGKKTFSANNE